MIGALRQVARSLGLLLAASLLTFGLLRLAPGDPIAVIAGAADIGGRDARAIAAYEARLRAELGLERPLPEQYARWLGRVVRLDLGTSFRTRQPVAAELGRRLPATLLLAGVAMALQAALALAGGLAAALGAGRWPDHLTRAIAVILAATPGFLLGWGLLALSTVGLGWYELSGPASLGRALLPGLVLGLLYTPTLMRVLRDRLLEELGRPALAFGAALGVARWRMVLVQALRAALPPVVALWGLNGAALLGGAVVIETIFSWPGIGRYAVESILSRDYPVIQGYVLLATGLVIGFNLVAELGGRWLDPRQRLSGRAA